MISSMKTFFTLTIIAVAGYLGYLVEPSLRHALTGVEPSAAEKAANTRVMLQLDGGVQVDLSSLPADQLPSQVTVNNGLDAVNAAARQVMRIEAGSKLKLVRIDGGNAVVSPEDPAFVGRIPVGETDLLQQIAAAHAAKVEPSAPPAAPEMSAPAPEPQVVVVEDKFEPERPIAPVVEPPNRPADEPVQVTEPADAAGGGNFDVVQLMKDSVKAGQIKEFTLDQVLDWKSEGEEFVDGEKFQIGVVSYKAETIFGIKTLQAKALVQGGKVQRWIRPKSGVEIK